MRTKFLKLMLTKKSLKKLIYVSSALLIITTTLPACALFPKEEAVSAPVLIEPPNITYKTVEAKKGSILKKLDVTGKLVSVKQHEYSFDLRGGYLKAFNFKAGDMINKGDVLAELDSDNLSAQLKLSEIRVKKAELACSQINANPAASEIDKQRAALDLEAEKIQCENLKKELAKMRLISRSSGVVVYAVDARIGSMVSPGAALYMIADPNDLQVEYVGQKAAEFRVGMKVNVSYGSEVIPGEVVISPEVAPKDAAPKNDKAPSKSEIVRIKLDKLPPKAKLNDNVQVVVELEKKDNVIVVPSNLVRRAEKFSYVQILENNSKIERFVELGIDAGGTLEILNGVNEGELLIEN